MRSSLAATGPAQLNPLSAAPMNHDQVRPFRPHEFATRLSRYVPVVYIAPVAFAKMQLYVEIADQEVGWLGTAERLPSGDF